MKFPGKRKSKHYFPVSQRDPLALPEPEINEAAGAYIVGIDQTLVDIEARVDDAFLARHGLSVGHSMLVDADAADRLNLELMEQASITHQFAGGTVGNTLHNYSVLADDRSMLLGVMSSSISIGSHAYRYLCNTSSRVDLNYLQGADGAMGRCFTLIGDSGERTFAISPGNMNQLKPECVPEDVVAGASALLITAYLLRCTADEPIMDATLAAIAYAKKYQVPVVLTLGTQAIIADRPEWWQDFIRENVTILAMNEEEACALTGCTEPLAAADAALAWTDLVICTAGPDGLYMAGYADSGVKRETRHPLLDGALPAFNRHEFSRAMRREACEQPERIYSHIKPYMGGPGKIMNTNGAGDGALAAVLHDIAANVYHRQQLPDSAKHQASFLTYSSLAQVCKYANRVSYQVLNQHSPRLTRGLPEREDSLEEAYWER